MAASSSPSRGPPEPDPGAGIKFDIPPALRQFTYFSRLPLELQDQIWEATVDDPGVQWLRLDHPSGRNIWGVHGLSAPPLTHNDNVKSLQETEEDPIKLECQFESTPLSTRAHISHPENPLADKSWHVYVEKQMATLMATTQRSQNHAVRMIRKADIEAFSWGQHHGSRHFVMLDGSRDLAFIEYLPAHLYASDCSLNVLFDTEYLAKFRNVAVRYHADWQVNLDPAAVCSQCGRFHGSTRAVTPRHLYHFLARTFPNLETVWLVDYMMVEKQIGPKADHTYDRSYWRGKSFHARQRLTVETKIGSGALSTSAMTKHPRYFRAIDRTFCEATDRSWSVKERVTSLRDWLQDAYLRYSRHSMYACHKSPEKVKFGILGCRHDQTTRMTAERTAKRIRMKKREADADPVTMRKTRRKLSLSADQSIFSFNHAYENPESSPEQMHIFGNGTLSGFKFGFEIGKLTLGD